MGLKKLKKQNTPINIKFNRRFSEAFKRTRVRELVNKRVTVAEITKLYDVSRTSVYNWLYKYSIDHKRGTKTVIQMESEAEKTRYLLDRTAELERIVGQKQLEIDFLSKIIEFGGEEVGFDIKKKYESQFWNGSENIKLNSTTT